VFGEVAFEDRFAIFSQIRSFDANRRKVFVRWVFSVWFKKYLRSRVHHPKARLTMTETVSGLPPDPSSSDSEEESAAETEVSAEIAPATTYVCDQALERSLMGFRRARAQIPKRCTDSYSEEEEYEYD
jgi:hypothetical protein